MENHHLNDSDEDFSDDDSSDNDSEDGEDEPMAIEDEVEVIGVILNEVINERQAEEGIDAVEEGVETEEVSSIDDMLTRDNYTELLEDFKEMVFTFTL